VQQATPIAALKIRNLEDCSAIADCVGMAAGLQCSAVRASFVSSCACNAKIGRIDNPSTNAANVIHARPADRPVTTWLIAAPSAQTQS
jgi:hypothetical protein